MGEDSRRSRASPRDIPDTIIAVRSVEWSSITMTSKLTSRFAKMEATAPSMFRSSLRAGISTDIAVFRTARSASILSRIMLHFGQTWIICWMALVSRPIEFEIE